jgi:NTP pyrophosphatase (non-canonical NTP hydrolase)
VSLGANPAEPVSADLTHQLESTRRAFSAVIADALFLSRVITALAGTDSLETLCQSRGWSQARTALLRTQYDEFRKRYRDYSATLVEPASAIVLDRSVSSIDDLLTRYLESRGWEVPVITTGEKIREEAEELIEAIASGDLDRIRDEVSDVAIVDAVIARHFGLTLEGAIAAKTAADAGRGGDSGAVKASGEKNPKTTSA